MRTGSQATLHQLRIGIKRFRYIIENFLPQQHEAWGSDLKNLQDLLGDVHDLDVLWDTAVEVNAFASPESRGRWQAIVHEAREKRINGYRERMVGPQSLWPVWRAELPQGKQIEVVAMTRLRLWSSYLDPDVAHSRRVSELARQLFEGMARVNLAAVSPNQDLRFVLQAASLMHNVGRTKNDTGRPKASYRIIRRMNPPLGVSSSQVQLAAAIARFHRGALPTLRHKVLREFALDQKKIVLHLAGILRLAHALGGGNAAGAERVSVETDGKGVVISAQGFNPWTRTAEKVAGAAYLLELVLRRPVLIKAAARAKPKTRRRSSQARPR